MMETDQLAGPCLRSAWENSILRYGPTAAATFVGLSLGSVLLEPVVLSEGKLPPLSAIRRYLLSFQTLTAVTNVDHRIAIWNEHHQAKVGDKTVRRMRALSNFRKQSGWILMGALIGHSILVFNDDMQLRRRQICRGHAAPSLSHLRNSERVEVKLLPPYAIFHRLHSTRSTDPVLVASSSLQGSPLYASILEDSQPLPFRFLDRDAAPELLSQSIIDLYSAKMASTWYQKLWSQLRSLFDASSREGISDGRIVLHSFDDGTIHLNGSTNSLLSAANWLTGWGSATDATPMDRHAYHKSVDFAVGLLSSMQRLLCSTPRLSSQEHQVELLHVHVCWNLNHSAKVKNISIHHILNTSGYLEEQQRKLLKIFFPLLLDVHLDSTNNIGDDDEELMHRLPTWQKLLLKLAFNSYHQQFLDMSQSTCSMKYQLHSLDGRPLLLSSVMTQLLALQDQHFPGTAAISSQTAPPPASPANGPGVPSASHSSTQSDGETSSLPSDTASSEESSPMWDFLSDVAMQVTEQVGRSVRNVCSSLVRLMVFSNAMTFGSGMGGRLPSANIQVFVDPESVDLTTILLSSVVPLSRAATVTQYILQGLYILGVDVQHDWSALRAQQLVPSNSLLPVLLPDHELLGSASIVGANGKVQMIVTLAKDPLWLQYRVRTLAQQFPGHPVCGILTNPNHPHTDGSINGQLPRQATIVSADQVMERVWRQF